MKIRWRSRGAEEMGWRRSVTGDAVKGELVGAGGGARENVEMVECSTRTPATEKEKRALKAERDRGWEE